LQLCIAQLFAAPENRPMTLNAEKIRCTLAAGIFNCNQAESDAISAFEIAKLLIQQSIFPRNSERNGQADAFRYCYWGALMTQTIGPENAKKVAKAHEEFTNAEQKEAEMDRHNVAQGINIGIRTRNDDKSYDACIAGVNDGTLKVWLRI
jgi:hypothetical protein